MEMKLKQTWTTFEFNLLLCFKTSAVDLLYKFLQKFCFFLGILLTQNSQEIFSWFDSLWLLQKREIDIWFLSQNECEALPYFEVLNNLIPLSCLIHAQSPLDYLELQIPLSVFSSFLADLSIWELKIWKHFSFGVNKYLSESGLTLNMIFI